MLQWYEGNPGDLGKENQLPSFARGKASALLGFDETIDDFCAHELGGWDDGDVKAMGHARRCVEANVNILSLCACVMRVYNCTRLCA
jgi:hypothetical protein